ncbi:hypothetical protein CPB86DRAFT_791324 [Serendipita vermifera]|nr:hypothetical protein CPB86DRAFT_791324 [Serendipita vermifera]
MGWTAACHVSAPSRYQQNYGRRSESCSFPEMAGPLRPSVPVKPIALAPATSQDNDHSCHSVPAPRLLMQASFLWLGFHNHNGIYYYF